MDKVMILAILVAYKAFNDKSLTVVTDEYVVNFAVIDSIDNDTVSLLSYANDDNYGKITINVDTFVDLKSEEYLIKKEIIDNTTSLEYEVH